jgi:membrane protein YqaA with SNARE-associated domain
MGGLIFALGWGFAEAILFFILPDVLLTALALKSGKKAFQAGFFALSGALIGGTVMYTWGTFDAQTALNVVEKVPAIDQAMIDEVHSDMNNNGLLAMALGPAQGIPYKIYAVTAAQQGIPFLAFLLVSIPARLVRFLLTAALAWTISHYLLSSVSLKTKYIILAGIWLIVYVIYFSVNPS